MSQSHFFFFLKACFLLLVGETRTIWRSWVIWISWPKGKKVSLFEYNLITTYIPYLSNLFFKIFQNIILKMSQFCIYYFNSCYNDYILHL